MQNNTIQPGRAPIFTIGHSNHDFEQFLVLLKQHDINLIADVRSTPQSRYAPHFDREILGPALKSAGIRYAFMGDVLGGRPTDKTCWEKDHVSYTKLMQHPPFQAGLERVLKGSESGLRIALMCSEREPIDCHRSLAITRALALRGVEIWHILGDGHLESQGYLEEARLMKKFGLDSGPGLFESPEELIAKAYALQEEKVAYRRGETTTG